jgi:hypothetical protein
MSIISAGTLVTNALTHTADRTGRLVFQTNGTTTALTLDSSQDATFAGGVTVTGNLTVAGTTTSFGDNDKIVLGDGQDLQIFHDGSHSNVRDTGTGDLRLQGANVAIQNTTGSESMATFGVDGAVQLFYDNSVKLATTSSGISVTGDISATGQISGNVGLTPQVITADATATAGNHYFLNSAGITLTLPSSPSTGDKVGVTELIGDTTSVVGRNGSNIMKESADLTIDTAYLVAILTYTGDATVGWAFT